MLEIICTINKSIIFHMKTFNIIFNVSTYYKYAIHSPCTHILYIHILNVIDAHVCMYVPV